MIYNEKMQLFSYILIYSEVRIENSSGVVRREHLRSRTMGDEWQQTAVCYTEQKQAFIEFSNVTLQLWDSTITG